MYKVQLCVNISKSTCHKLRVRREKNKFIDVSFSNQLLTSTAVNRLPVKAVLLSLLVKNTYAVALLVSVL